MRVVVVVVARSMLSSAFVFASQAVTARVFLFPLVLSLVTELGCPGVV
jgi:hypothetical protein